jgi:hypothetical protein
MLEVLAESIKLQQAISALPFDSFLLQDQLTFLFARSIEFDSLTSNNLI